MEKEKEGREGGREREMHLKAYENKEQHNDSITYLLKLQKVTHNERERGREVGVRKRKRDIVVK